MCSESDRPTSGNTLTPCDVGALSALAVQLVRFATCSLAPLVLQNLRLHCFAVCKAHLTRGLAFAFFAFFAGAFGAFGAGASTGVLGAPCASAMSVSMRASSVVMRLVRVGVVMAFLLCAYVYTPEGMALLPSGCLKFYQPRGGLAHAEACQRVLVAGAWKELSGVKSASLNSKTKLVNSSLTPARLQARRGNARG